MNVNEFIGYIESLGFNKASEFLNSGYLRYNWSTSNISIKLTQRVDRSVGWCGEVYYVINISVGSKNVRGDVFDVDIREIDLTFILNELDRIFNYIPSEDNKRYRTYKDGLIKSVNRSKAIGNLIYIH